MEKFMLKKWSQIYAKLKRMQTFFSFKFTVLCGLLCDRTVCSLTLDKPPTPNIQMFFCPVHLSDVGFIFFVYDFELDTCLWTVASLQWKPFHLFMACYSKRSSY